MTKRKTKPTTPAADWNPLSAGAAPEDGAERYSERERVWAYLRAHQNEWIAHTELMDAARSGSRTVTSLCASLLAAGHLARKGEPYPENNYSYKLLSDLGVHPPRLNAAGKPAQLGVEAEHLWRAMRMLGVFAPNRLAAAASTELVTVTPKQANKYCRLMSQAGYLGIKKKARAPDYQAVYSLIKDTGPKPPKVENVKRITDQNTGAVMATGVSA